MKTTDLKNEIKACLFDFDGTIIDSEKYHYEAWNNVARSIGADFTYEEYLPFKSAGRKVVIPYLLNKVGLRCTDELYDECYKLREAEISKTLKKLKKDDLIKGVVDFIKLLKENGILVAVASSSASATVTAKRFGIYDLFDAFVDGNALLAAKPKPDIFLYAARLLSVEPRNCVVFEDSINGLKGGKNAKMKVIGIGTYFSDIADKIIDDFSAANLKTIEF